jgi:hypothetical protein
MLRDRGYNSLIAILEDHPRAVASDARLKSSRRHRGEIVRTAAGLEIRELYAPDWKMWFPDEGDARHGRRTI